ncbi:MAG: hypothetical protein AAGE93_15065 [Bacteroidota bacterium]
MTKVNKRFYTPETIRLAWQPSQDEANRVVFQLETLIFYKSLEKRRQRNKKYQALFKAIEKLINRG